MSGSRNIIKAARSIGAHAEIAINFIDQGLTADPRISFLPLYYAIQNLSKIMIIASGRIRELENQRRHGARWSGLKTSSHSLLTDHITLYDQGTIPLLYKAITGDLWPSVRRKNHNGNWVRDHCLNVKMSDLYPYIPSVSNEFSRAFKDDLYFTSLHCFVVERSADKYAIEVEFIYNGPNELNPRHKYKLIKGFRKDGEKYLSNMVDAANISDASKLLMRGFPRFLLNDGFRTFPSRVKLKSHQVDVWGKYMGTTTPISSSLLLLPAEIPLVLVFFHLSNVVRYDPERLNRLFNSRAASLLEALSRQGIYHYLLLVWSYLMRCSTIIHNP
jgi:hypothetical protein